MNAFELNKIIGAILGALVFVMGLSVLSDIIFSEEAPEVPAYQIAVATDGAEEEAAPEQSFAVLLASADTAAGERLSRICAACHSFEEGGANKVGPGLYNVVGRPIAGHEGFGYSAALVAHAEGGKTWTYEELDGFLEDPQGWVPGTSMGYAGIKDAKARADVVGYLRSISPGAPPLPEPEAAPAQVASADAAGTASEAAAEGADPFVQLVASADPATGKAKGAVCVACHGIEAGAPPKLGPNIHGVFGRPIASDDYDYSPAMREHAEAGDWTVANLDAYLLAPMEAVPGTKMTYAGVKNGDDRAAVIAWLHSISPDAGPIMPETPVPAAATAAAPAEDADPTAAPATAGVADAATTGGEGTAPAGEVSPGSAAGTAAATSGETTPPLQGQNTAPTGSTDPGAGSLSPPAANTGLPDGGRDGGEGSDTAAGTPESLPAETSLEGAGGSEDPTMENRAAAGVARAAADEIEDSETETAESAVAPGERGASDADPAEPTPAATAPSTAAGGTEPEQRSSVDPEQAPSATEDGAANGGTEPSASASASSDGTSAVSSTATDEGEIAAAPLADFAAEPIAPNAQAADGTGATQPAPEVETAAVPATAPARAGVAAAGVNLTDGGTTETAPRAPAAAAAALPETAPAPAAQRSNVVIEPATEGTVEIHNPTVAAN